MVVHKLHNILLIFLLVLIACNSQLSKKQVAKNENFSFKNVAYEKYGNDTLTIYNFDKSFILCLKSPKNRVINPGFVLEFFVFGTKEKNIVYEDKIANANISWFTNNELLISIQKGIIVSPTDTGKSKYIYNLKTQEKSIYNSKTVD